MQGGKQRKHIETHLVEWNKIDLGIATWFKLVVSNTERKRKINRERCKVRCTVTSIPSPGTMNAGYFGNLGFVARWMDMAQLICRGCRSLLMYPHGATSVRCSCCHAVNLAPGYNQLAHVNCGNCWTTLMYPNGSPSVKCPVCQYVTNVSVSALMH
ncbi:LSD1-LIKE PROTEIN [Salix purpurea]|uniref:LSD1-LIKE PROTEIN n=1 Tax=Salix purpurea TaxID=77065 RepID=A0A9Q1A0B7_SALPP|nr:LSD1-LIKE PROTEIN [Salix purpurea]